MRVGCFRAFVAAALCGRTIALRPVGEEFAADDPPVSNILYVVRTCEGTQQARLPAILETWGEPLERDSLLVVGDADSESPKVYGAAGCAKDHWIGLNCKTGHALALAAGMMGSHSWAFVIDDDVYVNTTNLQSMLQKHDPAKSQALGIPGCGAGHCEDRQGGFCGGGGYALSRSALKALVDKQDPKDFHEEFLAEAAKVWPGASPFDDIVATCLMKSRGVKVADLKGLYGWRLEELSKRDPSPEENELGPKYRHAIHTDSPRPLTFHYIQPKEMYLIQGEFSQPQSAVSSVVSLGSYSSYDEQLRQYLHSQEVRAQSLPTEV